MDERVKRQGCHRWAVTSSRRGNFSLLPLEFPPIQPLISSPSLRLTHNNLSDAKMGPEYIEMCVQHPVPPPPHPPTQNPCPSGCPVPPLSISILQTDLQ